MGFVIAASVAFALGGALMKWSEGLHHLWPVLGMGLLFVLGGLLLALAVRDEGLSVAYVVGLVLIAVGVASVRFG